MIILWPIQKKIQVITFRVTFDGDEVQNCGTYRRQGTMKIPIVAPEYVTALKDSKSTY